MLSRKEGKRYIILPDGEREPVKLYQKKTDRSVEKLQNVVADFSNMMRDLYEHDYDLYRVLNDEVFDCFLPFNDGVNYRVESVKEALQDFQTQLQTGEDMFPEMGKGTNEQTLHDLGFTNYSHPDIWEKTIEYTEEQEVVEEIYFGGEEPVRRIRTILWEKTDYGKRSAKIRYRKLSIGKKLQKVIDNTIGK